LFNSPVEKRFIFWRERQSAISETYGNNMCMRVTQQFEMGLSPRMHQTSYNRHNPNGYGSLRVTPIACGHEAPKRHSNKHSFLSICILLILPSVIINNKDLLKTRLNINFYAQISCKKNDWNNFLLLYYCAFEDARSVSLYPYNRSQISQYVLVS